MMRLTARTLAWAVLVVLSVTVVGSVAGAQEQVPPTSDRDLTPGEISGSLLTIAPRTVEAGQRIDVIFTDWKATTVLLSVCGNLAKRGSVDCNQVTSQGSKISGVGISQPVAAFVVNPPSATCPCVIRAVGVDSDESAVAPIEIVGHPVGPVVDPSGGVLVEVGLEPRRADAGWFAALRSALGGPTDYDVAVTVRNISVETLTNAVVVGSVGHDPAEDLDLFEMVPGEIGAGQTWTGDAQVTLPSPAWGNYVWEAVASGAGPAVRAEESTRLVPGLLLVLVVVLVADLAFMLARWLRRRALRREEELLAQADGEGGENGPPTPDPSTLPPPPVLVS